MGRKAAPGDQQKGKKAKSTKKAAIGNAAKFMPRSQAIRKLQISLYV